MTKMLAAKALASNLHFWSEWVIEAWVWMKRDFGETRIERGSDMKTFNFVGFVKNLNWNAKILVVGLSLLNGPFGIALAEDQEQDFKILNSDIVVRAFEPLNEPRRSNRVIVTPSTLDFEQIFLKDVLTSSEKAAVKRLQALDREYIRRLANQQAIHDQAVRQKYKIFRDAGNQYIELLSDQPFFDGSSYWRSVESAGELTWASFDAFVTEMRRAPALNEPLQKKLTEIQIALGFLYGLGLGRLEKLNHLETSSIVVENVVLGVDSQGPPSTAHQELLKPSENFREPQ